MHYHKLMQYKRANTFNVVNDDARMEVADLLRATNRRWELRPRSPPALARSTFDEGAPPRGNLTRAAILPTGGLLIRRRRPGEF